MAKLKHVTIATQDPEKTANFYKEVFEFEMVGRVDNDNAEGHYLSDGDINLAIMRFKSETVAGEQGTEYSGLHHIGFQVEDMSAVDARLQASDSTPQDKINAALKSGMGKGHGGRNVEMKNEGADGVMIDVSQGGWVGA